MTLKWNPLVPTSLSSTLNLAHFDVVNPKIIEVKNKYD